MLARRVTAAERVDEPEPQLIRAAASGDGAAFEQLVRAYQTPVWRFLRHLVGDPSLAEDVTQETFLRVYQRLGTFSFQSKFSTWVLQVARNAGIDALRSQQRRARLARSFASAMEPAQPAAGDARVELQAAIASLSPKLREAILVVEVLGLPYREAAAVLRIPEGTVKSRVFQARERLLVWRAEGESTEGRAYEV
jgi:RNA polymerase sigma-70 factor (ECF subfamily)